MKLPSTTTIRAQSSILAAVGAILSSAAPASLSGATPRVATLKLISSASGSRCNMDRLGVFGLAENLIALGTSGMAASFTVLGS
jgi:hypothetical protein